VRNISYLDPLSGHAAVPANAVPANGVGRSFVAQGPGAARYGARSISAQTHVARTGREWPHPAAALHQGRRAREASHVGRHDTRERIPALLARERSAAVRGDRGSSPGALLAE
jgi:hypothetical protein